MDYLPGNVGLIKDKGIPIHRLDGDPRGIKIGLRVKSDFFGNPIIGPPDIGAVELPSPLPLQM